MKIAIKFGDNDFINTFHPLMNLLFEAFKHTGKLPTDKKVLLRIINSISFSFYILFQNSDYMKADKAYLQIDESMLLLNEEVDQYLNSLVDYNMQDNYSTFILDTELYNNNVYIV